MTITVLPIDADTTTGLPSYPALNERQALAAMDSNPAGSVFGGRSGFRVGTLPSIVSVTSTTWTLNPCSAKIFPAGVTYQGGYGWASDQQINGAMTAADAANPRIDILYIQVNDMSAGDGSGARTAPVGYAAGAAAGAPVAPTLPPRSFLVATIAVPKAGTGSPTITLNTARYVTAGAPVQVFSQAERDGLTAYDGFMVERMDLAGRPLETYNGSSYSRGPAAQGMMPGRVKVTANGAGLTTLAVQNNIGSFTFLANRKYKIVWQGGYSLSVASDYFNLAIQTCSTADAAGLITGLTTIQARSYTANNAGAGESFYVEAIYEPTADTTLQVKFTVARALGSGTWTLQASASAPSFGYIEDQGMQF